MDHTDHATALSQPVEAVCFTSSDGATQLRAGMSLGSGLVVELEAVGTAGRHEFRCDPGQASALGRWLVEKAAEYRHAAHMWVTVPLAAELPPSKLAGFDTLDQALAVVAGLSGLEAVRAV